MNKRNSLQLNCFSPPVMLTTLIIESFLVVYTIWRYKLTIEARLVTVTVLTLAIFQLCEYNVCTGYGSSADFWSRIGYIAITFLPPLGLNILHLLANKPKRRLVLGVYLMAVFFCVYFLVYKAAFIGYQCTGNYVIFQIGLRPALAYGLYYYGWLGTGIGLGIYWANQLIKSKKEDAKKRLNSVQALIVGYLVFLVPTALAYTIKPSLRRGIPSIMCGFAVLFALILTIYILPLAGKLRHQKSN